jgi:RecB family exonuclease
MFYAAGLPGWARFGGYATPYQNPDPNQEKQALKRQAEALQSELDFIKKRLSEIETGTAAE